VPPYAGQGGPEQFDGAYDAYGEPLTGPPTRDPRLPEHRPEQPGAYPVSTYAPTYDATYTPVDARYQTDPRYGADGWTDPSQYEPPQYRQPEQNWPETRPEIRPDTWQDFRPDGGQQQYTPMTNGANLAAPGTLRSMLPPPQHVTLQPAQAPSARGAPVQTQQPTASPAPVAPSAPHAAQNESDLEPDTQRPPSGGAASGQREMYAPARTDRTEKTQGTAPIVPAGSVTGRSLTLVISIMCFLACLTAGAVYMMNQSASAWLKDIASEVTVQVEGRDKADGEKTLNEVATFLNQQPGIIKARVLSLAESGGLLEPWIGNSEALKTLAVPRLIALEVDRNRPPEFEPLRAKLAGTFKGVFLDDHRQWQSQIRTVTRSFALGGLAILLLVAAATTAIIISATRAAMSSNRDIVEVLHFVGATDRFIAREFERNFLRVGVRAGLVGAISAMVVFALMPTLMELLGGGTVSLAEMRRLVGSGTLDLVGYLVLAGLVFVVAALCMLTSRFSVYRILHARQ
jgi:cell division transport system permease protein